MRKDEEILKELGSMNPDEKVHMLTLVLQGCSTYEFKRALLLVKIENERRKGE